MGHHEIIKTMSTTIELKKQELDLLLTYSIIDEEHTKQTRDKVLLSGTPCYFESLLDKLSKLLIDKGLDSNTDEPNKLGLKIETLIDIISREVYSTKE